ncbi:hypothetical protein HHK36_009343 [Tetracentron sinense]|uniref:Uncharacterized protein n=1 Tax=Tetracentron sinense TaxID=13715 RepID=A0A835DI69_TETSI|nr:hypothetical protein HHK36_009343 [Tetracentron sinense]
MEVEYCRSWVVVEEDPGKIESPRGSLGLRNQAKPTISLSNSNPRQDFGGLGKGVVGEKHKGQASGQESEQGAGVMTGFKPYARDKSNESKIRGLQEATAIGFSLESPNPGSLNPAVENHKSRRRRRRKRERNKKRNVRRKKLKQTWKICVPGDRACALAPSATVGEKLLGPGRAEFAAGEWVSAASEVGLWECVEEDEDNHLSSSLPRGSLGNITDQAHPTVNPFISFGCVSPSSKPVDSIPRISLGRDEDITPVEGVIQDHPSEVEQEQGAAITDEFGLEEGSLVLRDVGVEQGSKQAVAVGNLGETSGASVVSEWFQRGETSVAQKSVEEVLVQEIPSLLNQHVPETSSVVGKLTPLKGRLWDELSLDIDGEILGGKRQELQVLDHSGEIGAFSVHPACFEKVRVGLGAQIQGNIEEQSTPSTTSPLSASNGQGEDNSLIHLPVQGTHHCSNPTTPINLSKAEEGKGSRGSEVLSKLTTHFVRVHSRQCIDEAEVAEHVVGLTCSLASCQFRKKLTRLFVNANGSIIPKDFIDRNLIKKSMWLKALVAIPKVQPRFAIAIWKKYPTMRSLLSVYMDPSKSVSIIKLNFVSFTMYEKEFLLKDLTTEGLLGNEDRRLGEVCSKRVYRILMAQSASIKTDDVENGADFFSRQSS